MDLIPPWHRIAQERWIGLQNTLMTEIAADGWRRERHASERLLLLWWGHHIPAEANLPASMWRRKKISPTVMALKDSSVETHNKRAETERLSKCCINRLQVFFGWIWKFTAKRFRCLKGFIILLNPHLWLFNNGILQSVISEYQIPARNTDRCYEGFSNRKV